MNRAVGLLFARGWMNVCAFVSFIVVGRFLGPAEFGVYAVASSAVLLFMTMIGAGFAEHVISRDPERRDESAAFWCTVVVGAVGSLATAFAGLIVQLMMAESEAAPLLYMLAPLPLLWSLGVIHEATLIRDGRGGAIALVLFIAESAGLVALLVCLANGAGVYSLVASRIVNNGLVACGYFMLARTRLFSPIQRRRLIEMVRFAMGLVAARFVAWLDGYGSDLVLITLLPAASVGQYRMASRLLAAPSSVVLQAVAPAQLAYVSGRTSGRDDRLGRTLLKALRLHAGSVAPLFVLLAICAPDLVAALLGPKWTSTGIILMVMAAPMGLAVWPAVMGVALITQGLSRRVLLVQALTTALTTLGLVCGAYFSGPVGAAVCRVALGTTVVLASFYWIPGLPKRARERLWATTGGIALASAACAGGALLAAMAIPHPAGSILALARIAVIGCAGLATYIAALPFAAPATWRQISFLVRRTAGKWRRRARPVTVHATSPEIELALVQSSELAVAERSV